MGQYPKAEPLELPALRIYEKVLGPDHPDTATAAGNLGWLYCDKGEFAKAEPLELRALAIDEKKLGSEHVDTAKCLDDLGDLYRETGQYAKAEPLYQRALKIREKNARLRKGTVKYQLSYAGVYLGKMARPSLLNSLPI